MKWIIFCALLACAVAEMQMKHEGNNFMYSTGDIEVHRRKQTSGIDRSVSGRYSYVDPNGDLHSVNYRAGPGIGYQASGDIGVDKKTVEETAKIAGLALKVPVPLKSKYTYSSSPAPAPLYVPAVMSTPHGLVHMPLPLTYGSWPMTYNTLPYGIPMYFQGL